MIKQTIPQKTLAQTVSLSGIGLHTGKQVHLNFKPAPENTGFVFDAFNSDAIQISGLPVLMAESEVSIVLEELISNLQNEVPESSFSQSDTIAKSMAKSLAIKRGQSLQKDEQEHLVNKLFACKEPNVSPTNRATFITMSVDELDKKFI